MSALIFHPILRRGDGLLSARLRPDVAEWQRLLALAEPQRFGELGADGKFGKLTDESTRIWQRLRTLKPDGIVGPISWATIEGRPVPRRANPADLNAYRVALRAGAMLDEVERQYVVTVARGESFYGLAWKAGQGQGSRNWGAVQGVGPAGSFQHQDFHADGTPYVTAFRAYQSDDQGFQDMARILLKPNVAAALASGSLRDAVFAQHSNRYFELNPEKYLQAVARNYLTLTGSGVFEPLLEVD